MSKTNPTTRERMYNEYREFCNECKNQMAEARKSLFKHEITALAKMLEVASTGWYTAQQIADKMNGVMNKRQVAANMHIFWAIQTAKDWEPYSGSTHKCFFDNKKFKIKVRRNNLHYRMVDENGEPYGPIITKENAGPFEYHVELINDSIVKEIAVTKFNINFKIQY